MIDETALSDAYLQFRFARITSRGNDKGGMSRGPADSPPSHEHHGSRAATDHGNDSGTSVRSAEVRMTGEWAHPFLSAMWRHFLKGSLSSLL